MAQKMSSSTCVKQPRKFLNKFSTESLVEKLWIVAALVLGAAEPIIVKYGYRGALEPIRFFLIRNIMGGLVLAPVFFYFIKRSPGNLQLLRRVIPIAVLLMTTALCTILALRNLSAITVLTIVTTTPALVALINQKLGRDILGKKFWLGFSLCFAGVILSMPFGESFSGDWVGATAVFVAIFSSSFYRVKMDEITRDHNSIYISTYCFIILGIISFLVLSSMFAFSPSAMTITQHDLGYGIVVGICAAIANIAFIKALSLVGATRISVITMIQRPALILIAALILQEMPTWIQAIGIALVVVGINFAKVKRAAITSA
jgi:drug/metabolite transporter (DMT)-like permease